MADPLFRRMALLGVGLIGSSVARIARQRGDIAAEVVVNARTKTTLDRVMQLGIADRAALDPAEAVIGADCVMLCAPVGAFAELAARIQEEMFGTLRAPVMRVCGADTHIPQNARLEQFCVPSAQEISAGVRSLLRS